jgi:hypothetical protein
MQCKGQRRNKKKIDYEKGEGSDKLHKETHQK